LFDLRGQGFGAGRLALHPSPRPDLRGVRRDDGILWPRPADDETVPYACLRFYGPPTPRASAEIAAMFYLKWLLAFSEWDYAESYWEYCDASDRFWMMMFLP